MVIPGILPYLRRHPEFTRLAELRRVSKSVLIKPVFASESVSKNIFGLHLSQTSDIVKAAPIINSSGGDWGWATIVLRKDQLNKSEWQEFFNRCRRLHIQPIIRLASHFENGVWTRPTNTDIDNFANFLSELNWPTTKLPIILFNEINHGTEWGGEVDIKNYTDLALYASTKLHQINSNFIVLGAALDLAAPEKPPQYKSAENVYREIWLYNKQYFESLDGLASHSYPNPGFTGIPTQTGKTSILGYSWELKYLRSLGIQKNYDVYITETGWPSREGDSKKSKYFTRRTTVDLKNIALTLWQMDPRVEAVTFFTFNYPYQPFNPFSWVDKSETLYPEFTKLVNRPKSQNNPPQITLLQNTDHSLPILMLSDTALSGSVTIENKGQSIFGEREKCLDPTLPNDFQLTPVCLSENKLLEPQDKISLNFTFRIPKNYPHDITLSWQGIDPITIEKVFPNRELYRSNPTIFEKIQHKLTNILQKIKSITL